MTEQQNPDQKPNAQENTFSGKPAEQKAATENVFSEKTSGQAQGTFREEGKKRETNWAQWEIGTAIDLGQDGDAASFFINQVMSLNIFRQFNRKIGEYYNITKAILHNRAVYKEWKKDFQKEQRMKAEQEREKETAKRKEEQAKRKEEDTKKRDELAKKRQEQAKKREAEAKKREEEKARQKAEKARQKAEKERQKAEKKARKKEASLKDAGKDSGTRKKTLGERMRQGVVAKNRKELRKKAIAKLKQHRNQIKNFINNAKNHSATKGNEISRPRKGNER